MSFNFIPVTLESVAEEEELPIMYELARDLDTLEILTKNDQFYYVSKNEAIKIWILKALHMENTRYTYNAYTSDYGNEFSKLVGRHLKDGLLKSELKRYVQEALYVNPYIKKVDNFSFKKDGSTVSVTFTVSTVYGSFEQSFNYNKE